MRVNIVAVAEDEGIIALDIVSRLKKLGVKEVLHANSGQSLIEILKNNNRVDLVILDIMMEHGEAGLEAADYINSHFQIPIIFLTASTDSVTLFKAQSKNPLDIFIKPFNNHQFEKVIGRIGM